MSAAAEIPFASPGGKQFAAMACVADEETANIMRAAFAARDWSESGVQIGGVGSALSAFADGQAPKLVVIDAGAEDPRTAIRPLMLNAPVDTAVIVIGGINDVGVYRELRSSGVTDYLTKPVTVQSLSTAFAEALERQSDRHGSGANAPTTGRLILVTGARGGVGASTIALNAAWVLAHEFDLHTALVDLDLHFGTSALGLDLLPGRGLCEALAHPERLDALFVTSAMVQESEHLMVLGAEEPLDSEVEMRPDAVDLLLTQLRDSFQRILVDLPRHDVNKQQGLIADADTILMVSELSIAGVRDVIRMSKRIKEIAPSTELRVVGSRVGSKSGAGMSKSAFEESTELKLVALIEEDAKAASAGSSAGRAVCAVANRSRMAKQLRDLAKSLAEVEQPEKRGWFSLRKAS